MNQKLGVMTIIIFLTIVFFSFAGLRKEISNYVPFQRAVHSLADSESIVLEQNSRLLDTNGSFLYEFKGNESRIKLPYDQIPHHVKQAFIATEDQNFLTHHGIDGKAIARAFLTNTSEGAIAQGGSTITQQLARNLFLTHERSYDRKLKELLISYRIEQQLTKEQILELYINAIYFHNGIYGIEKASRFYFNKPASELTISETALLAAIPNNPKMYDPLTNLTNTQKRQKWILQKMKEQGFISDKEFTAAVKQPIKLQTTNHSVPFPEIIGFVKDELTELIASSPENKGISKEQLIGKRDKLLKSGVVIETSLIPSLQKEAMEAIQKRVPYSNVEGAVVVVDHVTKKIVAIAGGKETGLEQFNRAYQSRLQPGSSIKPLLVYAPYIDVFGATPNTIISAAKICEGKYCPKNYGGTSYGLISLKKAMASSVNTAAVRLLKKTGVEKAFSYLEPFQFSSINQQDYQLASALGGFSHGFSPLELTSAYTAFSNNGTYAKPRIITAVKDKEGNILYEWKETPVSVWKQETNANMRVMLEEVTRSGTAKNARFPGSKYIGGKTGTTNDAKDLWFIGITDRYTAGVWVGRDNPKSLGNVENSSPEVMIWRDIMMKAYQK
ncbi:transglycosylase domain-containing protein [Bacillus sp. NEB1478]|uniref:transglycosylase domain-containing protein n=1 Tax=Bacillus sp. NEB1478 TaxID=3073816 RepID=UPI00287399D8|nr:transglycosylase domain-containing protein [Bacillus sp. NEB1478]WNB91564.1 transglycosylase domain-containing protein [Bacillus sp. NEB1478]